MVRCFKSNSTFYCCLFYLFCFFIPSIFLLQPTSPCVILFFFKNSLLFICIFSMVYLTPFKMRCFMYKVRLIEGMMKVTPADDKMNQTWQASFPLTTFSLPRPAFSYLHVMRNDGLHLGKTYFMGHVVLGVDLRLL